MQSQVGHGIIRRMRVMIDTDPGGDDAIALLWLVSLARQGRIDLDAVTAAAGNVGARKTWRNACGLLALGGLNGVPVTIGRDRTAVRDAAEVHGEDGIGGLAKWLAVGADTQSHGDSSEYLQAELSRKSGEMSLLAVAPLSNLSAAEQTSPGLLAQLGQLIIMGGSLGGGNVTRHAEFNFYFDAAAAATVLNSGAPIRLVTLETSSTLRLGEQRVTEIVAGFEQHPVAAFFSRLCAFMAMRDLQFNPAARDRGFPVHDAATVAWLAYPDLFESRICELAVQTSAGECQGQLLESPGGPACEVATGVESDALLARLGDDLRWLFQAVV